MKTKLITIAAGAVLVLGALLLINAKSFRTGKLTTSLPAGSCCPPQTTVGVVPPYTDKSIYQVESTWTTDDGRPFKLGELAGKPQVVLMFFAHCTTACPLLLTDLVRINAALTPEQRAQIGFTLVTFDPERDTPTALAAYRKAADLPARNWTLLSGKPEDTLELALLLGVKYSRNASGQFTHSNIITVLNARGEIVYQRTGLSGDINETVQTLAKLIKP